MVLIGNSMHTDDASPWGFIITVYNDDDDASDLCNEGKILSHNGPLFNVECINNEGEFLYGNRIGIKAHESNTSLSKVIHGIAVMSNELSILDPCEPDLTPISDFTVQSVAESGTILTVDPVDITEDLDTWSTMAGERSVYYLMNTSSIQTLVFTWSGAGNGNCPFSHVHSDPS